MLYIHQTGYTERILERFNMLNVNPVSIPVEPGVKQVKANDEKVNVKFPYREMEGSVLFLAKVSRPDIAYAVNCLSRYLNNYDDSHCRALVRIFKYLKGTKKTIVL